jgi:hypothetical protein
MDFPQNRDSTPKRPLFWRNGIFGKKNTEDSPSAPASRKKTENSSSGPAYLQSISTLENSILYTTRKKVIQGNEWKYNISGTYTGTDNQNRQLVEFLRSNARARAEFERLVGATKIGLQELKTDYETTRSAKKGLFWRGEPRETRVPLSDAVRSRSTDTNGLLTDLNEASKFTYINAALNRAFIKDLEGPFLQWGLLAIFNDPRSKLQLAVEDIRKKYWNTEAEKVKSKIREISANAPWADQILSQKANLGTAGLRLLWSAASIFGFKSQREIQNYWATNSDFRAYVAKNIRKNLLSTGLSALGLAFGWVAFWGMVKTPFIVQRVHTPSKDGTAFPLFGKSARNMLGALDGVEQKIWDDTKFRGTAAEAARLKTGTADFVGSVAPEVANSLDQVGFWQFFWKIPLLGLVFDSERRLKNQMIEYSTLATKSQLTPAERERIYSLKWTIQNKLSWKLADLMKKREKGNLGKKEVEVMAATQSVLLWLRSVGMTETLDAISRNSAFEAFLMNNASRLEDIMPANQVTREAIRSYINGKSYKGMKGRTLADQIWTSTDFPGAQAMYRAYSQGNREVRNQYLQQHNPLGANVPSKGRTRGAYGQDMTELFSSKDKVAISARFRNSSLAYQYTETLARQSKQTIQIEPINIIRAIESRESEFGPFTGYNTSRFAGKLDGPKSNITNALIIRVRARINNTDYQTVELGIKPDCVNKVDGNVVQAILLNPPAKLSLRVPVWTNINGGGGGGKKENPGEPNKPGSNPGGGGNGGTPPDGGGGNLWTSGTGASNGTWALEWGPVLWNTPAPTIPADSLPGAVLPNNGGFWF